MKISIRKSKHSDDELSLKDIKFASECVQSFIMGNHRPDAYMIYTGRIGAEKMECDIYRTKTTISVIVK